MHPHRCPPSFDQHAPASGDVGVPHRPTHVPASCVHACRVLLAECSLDGDRDGALLFALRDHVLVLVQRFPLAMRDDGEQAAWWLGVRASLSETTPLFVFGAFDSPDELRANAGIVCRSFLLLWNPAAAAETDRLTAGTAWSWVKRGLPKASLSLITAYPHEHSWNDIRETAAAATARTAAGPSRIAELRARVLRECDRATGLLDGRSISDEGRDWL